MFQAYARAFARKGTFQIRPSPHIYVPKPDQN